MRAIDLIKESYVNEAELAELLKVDTKRLRDLRSNHITGKQHFINHIKPTSKSILYRVEDVLAYLATQTICSFGSNDNQDDDEPD